jgi:predicted ATP-binding protein involved in virulence
MRIDKIQIENFKNFEKLEVEFEKGVNLFVGSNGSGKTSILESINVALGGFFSLQEQKMQRGIDISEARIVSVNDKIIRIPKTSITAYSDLIEKPWTRNFNSKTKNNDVKYLKPAGEYGNKILESFYKTNNNVAPLIAYYSTQRLFKDASQSAKQKYDSLEGRRNGYLQCLKDNAIKGTLLEWLGNAVTSRATKQIKGVELVDLVLENVDEAVKKVLIFFLDELKEEDIKIFREPEFDFDVFLQLKPDFALPVNYYSDGFRNIIYLIIDIIWRASQLNPWLTLDQLAEQQTGCVTIDEIDLHLHPKWQAKTIGILQELLPNVQFFITTHSPTVVANFENGSLYIINENNIIKQNATYFGKEINAILRNVLGANDRHVPTQLKIDRLLNLIDTDPNNQTIEILLNELKDQIGADDPDLQKAISLWELSKYED